MADLEKAAKWAGGLFVADLLLTGGQYTRLATTVVQQAGTAGVVLAQDTGEVARQFSDAAENRSSVQESGSSGGFFDCAPNSVWQGSSQCENGTNQSSQINPAENTESAFAETTPAPAPTPAAATLQQAQQAASLYNDTIRIFRNELGYELGELVPSVGFDASNNVVIVNDATITDMRNSLNGRIQDAGPNSDIGLGLSDLSTALATLQAYANSSNASIISVETLPPAPQGVNPGR